METVLLSIIIVLKLDILTYLVTIVKVGSVLASGNHSLEWLPARGTGQSRASERDQDNRIRKGNWQEQD